MMKRPALPVEGIRQAEAAGGWKQTEALLQRRLEADPSDPVALEALGGLYRRLGRPAVAAAAYERLHAAAPDHPTAAYLAAVLQGAPLPVTAPQAASWPAPFVRVTDALPPDDRDRLLALARAHEAAFEPMEVVRADGSGYRWELDPAQRRQVGLIGREEVADLMRPHLLSRLAEVFDRLLMPPFEVGELNVQMALTHDGHFSKAHVDDGGGRYRVSCIYYFHRHPKAFTGGDLLLFDTNLADGRYNPMAFTRLVYEDNTLVLFPCPYFHEVTPVRCSSPHFEDGRFAVAAHVGARSGS